MTLEERVRAIMATEVEEAKRADRSLDGMFRFIHFHIKDAIRENREAIAKMVEDWGRHGQGGYCMDVYPQIAQAIREGKTCIHDWIDVRNKVITSGEMCRLCGALRAGNEATGEPEKAWKFRALDVPPPA